MVFIRSLCGNENGVVLTTALLFITILALLGSAAVVATTTDIQIGANFKDNRQALYDAEAGVYYAIAKIEADLKAGNISLPSRIGNSTSLFYHTPSGFSFIVSNVSMTHSNRYVFASTGAGSRASKAEIEVSFKRDTAIHYGAFGDVKACFEAHSNLYSYDSRVTSYPTPSDSTGKGNVGSNGFVSVKNDSLIDGEAALGDDDNGNEAALQNTGATFIGTAGVDVERIDPDPLGVVGGAYATRFTTYSNRNDNFLASSAITGDELILGNGMTTTLNGKAGGANYYLTNIRLGDGAQVVIDASAGPVNVFLTGRLSSGSGADIHVIGNPTDFSLFSNSNTPIDINNSGSFRGFIYAPYAKIELANHLTLYGAVWGREVEMKNSVDFYYDTALQEKFLSNDLILVSWRDVRS